MLIKSDFEVAQPVDKVWQFFDDIPQVAACLPGAELTDDLGDDKYLGKVAIRMGPVKLQFAGTAQITERDDAGKTHRRGRGRRRREGPRPGRDAGDRARWCPTARRHQGRGRAGPAAVRRRRAVRPRHDLRRHRRPDARLRHEHADPHRRPRPRPVAGPDRGRGAGQRLRHRPAGRVAGAAAGSCRRFFLPYQPNPS